MRKGSIIVKQVEIKKILKLNLEWLAAREEAFCTHFGLAPERS